VKRERHPQNVDGPFYVENGQCMGCGAPEVEADGLMSHDATGHCFFVLQPSSTNEVDSAIRATWAGCCGAIRYNGDDPVILTRLAELGEASLCDQHVSSSIKTISRNQVRFEYRNSSMRRSGCRKGNVTKAASTVPDTTSSARCTVSPCVGRTGQTGRISLCRSQKVRMSDGVLRYRLSEVEEFVSERERLSAIRRKHR